jgi:hypothetical protein
LQIKKHLSLPAEVRLRIDDTDRPPSRGGETEAVAPKRDKRRRDLKRARENDSCCNLVSSLSRDCIKLQT